VRRAFFRTLSLVSLAAALVAAVLDLTRSIADNRIVLTPLHDDWQRLAPSSLEAVRLWVSEALHPLVWSPVMESVLSAPSWTVLALLAIVFAMAARRRKRRWQENFGA